MLTAAGCSRPAPTDRLCGGAPWIDGAWRFRQRLVLHPEVRALSLQNFAVPVRMTTAGETAAFWSHVDPSGNDIRFTDCAGHPLKSETELFDPESRRFVAWVSLPQIGPSATEDAFFVYYGDPSAAASVPDGPIWDADTRLVLHMERFQASSRGVEVLDSSRYQHHGRLAADVTGLIDPAGVYGGALHLNGGSGLTFPDDPAWSFGADDWTIEFWVKPKPEALPKNMSLLSHGDAGVFNLYRHGTNFLVFELSNNDVTRDVSFGEARLAADAWTMITAARRSDKLELWVDLRRYESTRSLQGFVAADPSTPLVVGGGPYGALAGSIDEVRVSKGLARSRDWIIASMFAGRSLMLKPEPEERRSAGAAK